ncbi:LysR family transcriptional regulator [Roseomonas eburnea]|uniref:LysR family transcriptional regulator n=1 Tax=Neoroseomonas eburnea TaxID=1346889 RepID=A0A9X9XDQ2_9PROT|nr:LysR family transcriptional regulator [Neoroseomonas eburnea]MBR0681838.1 LysR family transcriptional regulator [Neoroseomonas eburnea]
MDTARDIRKLDLDLLRLFLALMEERHVTRAAGRLFLSQPAASQRLARLRTFFGDQLLVSVGKTLQPTPLAETLYASVLPALRALERAVAIDTPFDAANDERVFRLGASDMAALILLPRLLARMRTEAPHCRLVLREGDHRRLPALLAQNEVSTVIGFLGDNLPATARQRSLGSLRWVTVRDAGSPAVASLAEFCARPHAMVTAAGDLHGIVDEALEAVGQRRTVVLGVADFAMLAPAVTGTDLIAAVPAPFAALMAEGGGIAIDELPIALSVAPHGMAWNASVDRDPAERWFRAALAASYQDALRDARIAQPLAHGSQAVPPRASSAAMRLG